jgi:hypothetical protein
MFKGLGVSSAIWLNDASKEGRTKTHADTDNFLVTVGR